MPWKGQEKVTQIFTLYLFRRANFNTGVNVEVTSPERVPLPSLSEKEEEDLLRVSPVIVSPQAPDVTYTGPGGAQSVRMKPPEGKMMTSNSKLPVKILWKWGLQSATRLNFIVECDRKGCQPETSSYLKSSNLDTKFQSAYKKDHSTETTLLKVLNDALRAADAKQPTLLVLLDLSAAFDTIDHELLLSRLDYRFGISGAALQWLRSYLTGRMQSVFIDSVSSPVSSLQFGVPQGSVLGPLLFTLYTSPVADIAECYDAKYHLYADDTQIYISLDADGQV
ncbi:reverse transcriptase [Elysia marginata]|uniref:Reverse transcriptase n=1 Tax=Elysia marginata TaxID=1093978 RepID=A0AAV4GS34_9GAST|nr:reverse transcriptase [Elysia marginata]